MLLLSVCHVGLFGITVSADTVTGTSGYYSYKVFSKGAAKITKVDASISGDIIIPSELGGYTVTSIGDEAFSYCESLTGITVGENNSAYSSLNGVLFNKTQTILIRYPAGKSDLSYTIPNSVTSIGSYAFEGCTSLTDVYYTGTEDEWNSISVGSSNTCLTNATIHCNYTPSTSVPGDLSGDGIADYSDLVILKQAVLMGNSPEGADINGDGAVDSKDIVALKNIILESAGDLNGDGSITADDLIAMRKAILMGETAVNADMNIDGAVNIKDLIALKKLLA